MSVQSRPTDGGGHEVYSDTLGYEVVLVIVRPVGTLQWGSLPMFAATWVSEMVEALWIAHAISEGEPHAPMPPETGHDMGVSMACEMFPQFRKGV